jgi:hypothetical protein
MAMGIDLQAGRAASGDIADTVVPLTNGRAATMTPRQRIDHQREPPYGALPAFQARPPYLARFRVRT